MGQNNVQAIKLPSDVYIEEYTKGDKVCIKLIHTDSGYVDRDWVRVEDRGRLMAAKRGLVKKFLIDKALGVIHTQKYNTGHSEDPSGEALFL